MTNVHKEALKLMRPPLFILLTSALAASCSKSEEASLQGSEKPLCTAEAAAAVTAEKATELLNGVRQSEGAERGAACSRFKQVIEDGSEARIPNAPDCRWDTRNSNGNPHFLVSMHLTQLKGQARKFCGELE
jgi:hypothetical protein